MVGGNGVWLHHQGMLMRKTVRMALALVMCPGHGRRVGMGGEHLSGCHDGGVVTGAGWPATTAHSTMRGAVREGLALCPVACLLLLDVVRV